MQSWPRKMPRKILFSRTKIRNKQAKHAPLTYPFFLLAFAPIDVV